ncbi:unnamed protein product [Microthlaspi erraticum]|nr:unnamed protein product [Microthlaspi erraticum]
MVRETSESPLAQRSMMLAGQGFGHWPARVQREHCHFMSFSQHLLCLWILLLKTLTDGVLVMSICRTLIPQKLGISYDQGNMRNLGLLQFGSNVLLLGTLSQCGLHLWIVFQFVAGLSPGECRDYLFQTVYFLHGKTLSSGQLGAVMLPLQWLLIYAIWRQRNNFLHNVIPIPLLTIFKDIDRQIINSINARRSRKNFRNLMGLWLT